MKLKTALLCSTILVNGAASAMHSRLHSFDEKPPPSPSCSKLRGDDYYFNRNPFGIKYRDSDDYRYQECFSDSSKGASESSYYGDDESHYHCSDGYYYSDDESYYCYSDDETSHLDKGQYEDEQPSVLQFLQRKHGPKVKRIRDHKRKKGKKHPAPKTKRKNYRKEKTVIQKIILDKISESRKVEKQNSDLTEVVRPEQIFAFAPLGFEEKDLPQKKKPSKKRKKKKAKQTQLPTKQPNTKNFFLNLADVTENLYLWKNK